MRCPGKLERVTAGKSGNALRCAQGMRRAGLCLALRLVQTWRPC